MLQGIVPAENRMEYPESSLARAIANCRCIAGNLNGQVLQRKEAELVQIVTLTAWKCVLATSGSAGSEETPAKYYAEHLDIMRTFENLVTHDAFVGGAN